MGLTSVDSSNGCNCGCEECLNKEKTFPTDLVRTVQGVRRHILYYDPDVFCETILISTSLLIGDQIDDPNWEQHYNLTHDEDKGTNGTSFQNLEDITIAINPKPTDTKIKGAKRMDLNESIPYIIDDSYDKNNLFIYDWKVSDGAMFDNNSDELLDGGKEVNIIFNKVTTVTISLLVSNTCGCKRLITRDVYPGTKKKSLLVVRYPYF